MRDAAPSHVGCSMNSVAKDRSGCSCANLAARRRVSGRRYADVMRNCGRRALGIPAVRISLLSRGDHSSPQSLPARLSALPGRPPRCLRLQLP